MNKHNMILRSATAFLAITCILVTTLTPTQAAAARSSTDDSTNNDATPSSSTTSNAHQLISTPTYAQTMQDAIRELMEDFSHMTALTESFVHHPLFSRFQLPGGDANSNKLSPSSSSKPFSTWGTFGSLTRWSPRYEVIDNAKMFQVKLDVPGFHFHEMKVELESGGRVLSISGTKEDNVHETSPLSSDKMKEEKKAAMGEKANKDDDEEDTNNQVEYTSHSSTSFQQKFTLDPSIDTSLMTANLVNGVLEVRAPRKHGAWNKRHVPITQFDEDVWEELVASVNEEEAGGDTAMKE